MTGLFIRLAHETVQRRALALSSAEQDTTDKRHALDRTAQATASAAESIAHLGAAIAQLGVHRTTAPPTAREHGHAAQRARLEMERHLAAAAALAHQTGRILLPPPHANSPKPPAHPAAAAAPSPRTR